MTDFVSPPRLGRPRPDSVLVVDDERISMAPDGIGRDVFEVGVVGGNGRRYRPSWYRSFWRFWQAQHPLRYAALSTRINQVRPKLCDEERSPPCPGASGSCTTPRRPPLPRDAPAAWAAACSTRGRSGKLPIATPWSRCRRRSIWLIAVVVGARCFRCRLHAGRAVVAENTRGNPRAGRRRSAARLLLALGMLLGRSRRSVHRSATAWLLPGACWRPPPSPPCGLPWADLRRIPRTARRYSAPIVCAVARMLDDHFIPWRDNSGRPPEFRDLPRHWRRSLLQRSWSCAGFGRRTIPRLSCTHTRGLRQAGSVEPPHQLAREGARRMLVTALEAEIEAFLDGFAEERLADGRQRVVRHGHGPNGRSRPASAFLSSGARGSGTALRTWRAARRSGSGRSILP